MHKCSWNLGDNNKSNEMTPKNKSAVDVWRHDDREKQETIEKKQNKKKITAELYKLTQATNMNLLELENRTRETYGNLSFYILFFIYFSPWKLDKYRKLIVVLCMGSLAVILYSDNRFMRINSSLVHTCYITT